MFALVDCNSFFCSVEKVFHPGLEGKPVCVLSNNDGCICALTPEAKALGLHRGDPLFKVKDLIRQNRVRVFSGNMVLYAAMSKRVISILRKSAASVENYSIDESFCDLAGYERFYDLETYMREVADKIRLWTGVPVSVGIAPSKTLAKIGSKFAKRYSGYRSVCIIDSQEKRRTALSLCDYGDIWGIGKRSGEKLLSLGIRTPLEFADRNEFWVKSHFHRPLVQTWMELNGIPCIDTAEVYGKQSITTSRSFGSMVHSLDELQGAVATFAASCANKLRAQKSVTGCVNVFVCGNKFRRDLEQYQNFGTMELSVPSSDSIEITKAALSVLNRIYKDGIMYKKAGVIISKMSSERFVQQNIFDGKQDMEERFRLSKTMDSLNRRFGVKTVQVAVAGDGKEAWRANKEHRSGDYLTKLDGLLTVG